MKKPWNESRFARYRKTHPWVRLVEHARRRCSTNPDVDRNPWWPNYGAKGITCDLTAKQLAFVWNRDEAWKLKKPSLDRIDASKGYTLDNVRIIEFTLNARMAWDPTKRDGYAEQAPEFT